MYQQVSKALQRRFRLVRTTYMVAGDVLLPAMGTRIDGGGIVTNKSDRSVTVEYASPSDPIYLKVEGVETTVICEYVPVLDGGHPISSGGGISDIHVGDMVNGGGTVTGVTPTTVTVKFPNGPPAGPIRLPGSETTVIDETSPDPSPEEIAAEMPLAMDDEIKQPAALDGFFHQLNVEGEPNHRRFRVPCPGSRSSYIWLLDDTLKNPTNLGSCPLYLMSFGPNGKKIPGADVRLAPGRSVEFYRRAPDAVFIVIAGATNCGSGFSDLQVDVD